MKRHFLTIVIVFSTVFVNHIFATTELGSKIYLSKKSVTIKNKKIFIKTKHGDCAVKAIYSDKNGVFVLKSELVRTKRLYRCPWPNCDYTTDQEDYMECHMWQRHRGWNPGDR
jgi:hypothetical protein